MRHHHESCVRLMAAPTNVLFIKMDYDDFQSASADLAVLAKDGRFHHLAFRLSLHSRASRYDEYTSGMDARSRVNRGEATQKEGAMKYLLLFAILLPLGACQNPGRFHAAHENRGYVCNEPLITAGTPGSMTSRAFS
jgi:hypothetical protein